MSIDTQSMTLLYVGRDQARFEHLGRLVCASGWTYNVRWCRDLDQIAPRPARMCPEVLMLSDEWPPTQLAGLKRIRRQFHLTALLTHVSGPSRGAADVVLPLDELDGPELRWRLEWGLARKRRWLAWVPRLRPQPDAAALHRLVVSGPR